MDPDPLLYCNTRAQLHLCKECFLSASKSSQGLQRWCEKGTEIKRNKGRTQPVYRETGLGREVSPYGERRGRTRKAKKTEVKGAKEAANPSH